MRSRSTNKVVPCLVIVVALSIGSAGTALGALGDQSADRLWTEVDGEFITETMRQAGAYVPPSLRAFEVDIDRTRAIVRSAPMERDSAGLSEVTITLPLPDGSYMDFHVEESPIVSPAATERLDFRTYRLRGVGESYATGRLTVMPWGLDGLIRTNLGTVRVLRRQGSPEHEYVSYFMREDGGAECNNSGPQSRGSRARDFAATAAVAGESQHETGTEGACDPCASGSGFDLQSQTLVRTYKIALVSRVDYTEWFETNFPGLDIQAHLYSKINMLNAIFRPDLALLLQPVEDDRLIFHSADPVNGACDGTGMDPVPETLCPADDPCALAKVACVLRALRDMPDGIEDFDVGHLVGKGNGCNSAGNIGGVCVDDDPNCGPNDQDCCEPLPGPEMRKSRGMSQANSESILLKILAHELGHQLGGSHTFSTAAGGCPLCPNRRSSYEPGSGTTIMSYAGPKCAPDDIQDEHDDYFHIDNIEWIKRTLDDNDAGCVHPPCPSGEKCTGPPPGPPFCIAWDTGNFSCRDELGEVHSSETFGETIVQQACTCNGGSGSSWYFDYPGFVPNNAPIVATGGTFGVPSLTPFTLAGLAMDLDGESPTFTWEQFDHDCQPSDWRIDDPGPDPLFRSQEPTSAQAFGTYSRVFRGSIPGEILPVLEDTLTMRLVVRDGVGGVSTATTTIDVDPEFDVVVTPTPLGTPTPINWSPVYASSTVELSLEEPPFGFRHLVGPIPNEGSVVIDLELDEPSTANKLLLSVKQTEPSLGLTTLEFDYDQFFSTYGTCPTESDCGACPVDKESCETTSLSSRGCFKGDVLTLCPSNTVMIDTCDCAFPCEREQEVTVYCDCTDQDCDDGNWCTGQETCNPEIGCIYPEGPCGLLTCDGPAERCTCPSGQECAGRPDITCSEVDQQTDYCDRPFGAQKVCGPGETIHRSQCGCDGSPVETTWYCAPPQ